MRMDKLTNQLQNALADAQSLAVGRDNQYIEPAHVLKALLEQQGGSSRPLLQKAGANLSALTAATDAAVNQLPTVNGASGDVHISQDCSRLLNRADKQA